MPGEPPFALPSLPTHTLQTLVGMSKSTQPTEGYFSDRRASASVPPPDMMSSRGIRTQPSACSLFNLLNNEEGPRVRPSTGQTSNLQAPPLNRTLSLDSSKPHMGGNLPSIWQSRLSTRPIFEAEEYCLRPEEEYQARPRLHPSPNSMPSDIPSYRPMSHMRSEQFQDRHRVEFDPLANTRRSSESVLKAGAAAAERSEQERTRFYSYQEHVEHFNPSFSAPLHPSYSELIPGPYGSDRPTSPPSGLDHSRHHHPYPTYPTYPTSTISLDSPPLSAKTVPASPHSLQPSGFSRAPISRTTKACNACRQRKVRCDAGATTGEMKPNGEPGTCSRCKETGVDCIYTTEQRKRGPMPGSTRPGTGVKRKTSHQHLIGEKSRVMNVKRAPIQDQQEDTLVHPEDYYRPAPYSKRRQPPPPLYLSPPGGNYPSMGHARPAMGRQISISTVASNALSGLSLASSDRQRFEPETERFPTTNIFQQSYSMAPAFRTSPSRVSPTHMRTGSAIQDFQGMASPLRDLQLPPIRLLVD